MMKLIKKRMSLRSNGFLLSEAIFSVLITLFVVITLQNLLKSIATTNKTEHRTDNVVFAYVQFNRFLHDDNTKIIYIVPEYSNSKQVALRKIDKTGEDKIYNLNFYKNMIRATTNLGGHMPLLLDVKRAQFSISDQQVKINVTEADDRQSELYFKVDKRPEKKALNEGKTKKTKSKG
ncbi:ComGF family competence protein [Lactobacillus sp. ESL0785]|uniref:ComGF family competence protein n=1 Tax=Lactobacillus sp. ESL0785 TaxID=2983232 RepID=UPI0023FA16A3|nr:ComGF family competence protein [Lactobacillus sp. ESL0785]WEV71459.1 ComGF family competence protein [Lactobacillus sp. ESL0785]